MSSNYGWSKPKSPEHVDTNPDGGRVKHVFTRHEGLEHVWAHPKLKDGSGYYQTHGRNPQGNYFFHTDRDGTRVIFSYRDSYPIGAMFEQGRQTVYLIRSGKPYSNTTAQHMSRVRGSVPHGAVRFDIPFVIRYSIASSQYGQCFASEGQPDKATHKANLADILERLAEHIGNQTRARGTSSLTWNHKEALRLRDMAKRYARVFGLKTGKLATVPAIDRERYNAAKTREDARAEARRKQWEAIEQRRKAEHERAVAEWDASGFCKHTPAHGFDDKWTCESQTQAEEFQASGHCKHEPMHTSQFQCDHVRELEEFKASGYCKHEPTCYSKSSCDVRERREQDERNAEKTLEEKIALWRQGVRISLPYRMDYALLRIVARPEPSVETSQGASVPIQGRAGAARLFRFLKALVDSGREYVKNGHTEHIGSFAVDSFKPSDATDPLTGPANEWVLIAGCHRILWSEILELAPAVLAADAQGTANPNPFGEGTSES